MAITCDQLILCSDRDVATFHTSTALNWFNLQWLEPP